MIHNETHLNQIYCTVHTVCERRRVQTKACRFPTFTCPLFIKCWPAKCSAGCRGITSGNGTTIINITDSKVGLSVYTPRLFHSAMSRGPCALLQCRAVTYPASGRCCRCCPNSHDVCCGNEAKARELTGA